MPLRFFVLLLLFVVPTACAQDRTDSAELFVEPLTETEQQVQALLEEDGIYVVHFWAPWCHNSKSEFRGFWDKLIAANDEVEFIFVTVFNDGHLGEETLAQYNIPERVHRFAQPDHGRSSNRENRRKTFLGFPLTWTPTTWVFHKNGRLAFAANYGEVSLDLMQTLIDNTQTNWSH